MLDVDVIETDHQLEARARRARTALAEHRWRWTVDPTNSKRVSFREYADAVGRDFSTIRDMVRGYERWRAAREGGSPLGTLNDHVAEVKLGADAPLARGFARARGISIETARKRHRPEVRNLREAAERRAERDGVPLAEAAYTEQTEQQEGRTAPTTDVQVPRFPNRDAFNQVSGRMTTATRSLRDALALARGVEFSVSERARLDDLRDQAGTLLDALAASLAQEPGGVQKP